MAMMWSGSNGGITTNHKKFSTMHLTESRFHQENSLPKEVSYFVNNICHLKCKHCYVGYNDPSNSLTVAEWKDVFDELIVSGARTFGNVGKEPLLSWDETSELLWYFKSKKNEIPSLRFGFVTNGILLDEYKIAELEDILPDYIDISLDGNRKSHDWIRGSGNFDKLMQNLSALSKYEILKKVFIGFTLNRINISSISEVIKSIYNLGIRNILISPYVTLNTNDTLYISNEDIIAEIQNLIDGRLVDFRKHEHLNIFIKNDFTATKELMEEMANRNIINKNELLIDDYGVIFNKYSLEKNNIYFNYLPWDTSYIQAIRISHNGFVSNCLDMFYENYPERAIGNVKEKSITEILENSKTIKGNYICV